MTDISPEGQQIPAEEWDPQVPEAHRNFVDNGYFDRLPQVEELKVGDVVVARDGDKIYQVYGQEGDSVIIGFDQDEKQVRRTVPTTAVRDINSYAVGMCAQEHPNVKIQVDRHGHAIIQSKISNTPPKYPGSTPFSKN